MFSLFCMSPDRSYPASKSEFSIDINLEFASPTATIYPLPYVVNVFWEKRELTAGSIFAVLS